MSTGSLTPLDQLVKNASHYWPMESPYNLRNLKATAWVKSEKPATIIGGVQGNALKLDGTDGSWIDLTEISNPCFLEPTKCVGMTMALWLRYYHLQAGKTFLSVGDETAGDQGFKIYQVMFCYVL